MIKEIGFDSDKYLKHQKAKLKERTSRFEKLYLEFGGKLFTDNHATRVLPGYRPTSKIELLKQMGNIDLFYCVSAEDVVKGKTRGDSGLSYDLQTIKDIKDIRSKGIEVSGVVITLFKNQPTAIQLKRKMENLGYKVYIHKFIKGYPQDLKKVISGYKKQPYVKTDKNLVVITGAGGGSGKMAFCLSQIYNDKSKGINSGYAKFETFPIWNLPTDHPVNVAYEAATADLKDINQIDPYHEKFYGVKASSYNRDIENFTILKSILVKITGEKNPYGYKSPTDMGVNTLSLGITNKNLCKKAAKEEILRRYFLYLADKVEGKCEQDTMDRISEIMEKLNLKPENRAVVKPARKARDEAISSKKGFNGVFCGSAIELGENQIITGKNSPILHAESAAVLNCLKVLANIPDSVDLISPGILSEIGKMKGSLIEHNSPSLSVDETLIALASCSLFNPTAKSALNKAIYLKGCEMHSTHAITKGDALGLRNLGINFTSDNKISSIDY